MVSKRPRIVIIGAGMAGLTAANKLHTTLNSKFPLFDLAVVEGGDRIGGRISTAEFSGDRIEQGATWIHGIEGSPVFKIAQETNSLTSDQPWECMDGISEDPITVAEGGFRLNPAVVEPISSLFQNLMDFIQGKPVEDGVIGEIVEYCAGENLSVGNFLRRGLEAYWALGKGHRDLKMGGTWTRKSLEQGVFAMHESIQRTFTSADDLFNLDYDAEKEYVMFPGEEITIAKGYSSVIEHLASVLPAGMIQFGKKVERIEWQQDNIKSNGIQTEKNGYDSSKPVKLHFSDGSSMSADHVIVTVSLGVLKQAITGDSGMFLPPLPGSKVGAISRLGYGVVNKVFLQLDDNQEQSEQSFPFLQMVFHPSDSELRSPKIPHWMRRTSFLCPIYRKSRVVLSWFTGQEALHLESLSEEDIISGFSKTVANLLPSKCSCNGHSETPPGLKFEKVLRTQWGTNPLFLGSYSFVAVGSSIDDMDVLSEPLPTNSVNLDSSSPSPPPPPPLQLLFAGEATHKTHYSTTHGAYFSGLREANRLLKHYNYMGFV